MIGTKGTTSSKIPKKAPTNMKKKEITSSKMYLRLPNFLTNRARAFLRMPVLSRTAKDTPTISKKMMMTMMVNPSDPARTSKGAVNQRQIG